MKISEDDYLYFQKICQKNALLAGKGTTVGIHGIKGSFTDEALFRLTQAIGIKEEDYTVEELIHSQNVIKAVVDGKIDRGIFAVANSGSGAYLASIQAMANYNFNVLAVFTMKINMCIISKPGIKSMKEIGGFRGHPVAIAQCRRTLKKKWPKIPIHPDTDEMDTALSVKLLREGRMDNDAAVFASERAADLYNMRVLIEGAHDDPLNATSFVVIKK